VLRFECSWPTTTRHLKQLERAKLIRVEKAGRERIYQLEVDRLEAVAGAWLRRFDGEVDS
jgi:DNA-binding transcriptional ArsR family regulator